MSALVLADLAVETAAWAAARDESLPGKTRWDQGPSLPAVLEALNRAWQKKEQTTDDEPSEIREAKRLHGIRNTVQHSGFGPSTHQVLESRVGSRRFLAWVSNEWFGVPLESISRARLIKNAAVRNEVEQAEKAAAGNDYSAAAKRLAVAFEMARWELRAGSEDNIFLRPVTQTDVSAAISEVREGSGDRSIGWPRTSRLLNGVVYQLDTLADQVEALSLGARASNYTWFKRNFPRVQPVPRAGEVVLVPDEPAPIDRAVYLQGLDFVTTTALHWQEFPIAKRDSDHVGED